MDNSNGVKNSIIKEFSMLFVKLLPLWLLIFAWSVRVEGFMNNQYVTQTDLTKVISEDYRKYLESRFDSLEKQLDEIKEEIHK